MKKAKNSHAAPIVAVSVFFCLVAVGGWLMLVAPQHHKSKALDAQIESVQSEAQQRELAVHVATGQSTEIRTADLFRLTKAMPNETDMPGILLELSRVARQTGIQFDSITPQSPSILAGYQIVPVSLVFQGNFYDLADFVYRLRNLVVVHKGDLITTGRLYAVDSIDFGEGQNKFPQIQATLVVDAFVYGATAPTATAGAAPATTDTTSTDGTTTSTDTTSTETTPSPTTPPLPPSSASAAGATN